MFYSQFILAKKGPLGTIWIAAHLERKLRKNQVADTDIGVSVDSILFPDVPIALRLSSHLLLGVVRIYSRKVNYLFHDCSEALLKVKQAFRSSAVDLPPEESTAPYHSITLPETFHLDDFELPDSAIHGDFVDHHVSAKEHITLQDTMDGMGYSTLQFGLDERFGDGNASQIGLDLDEDLFLEDNHLSSQHANTLVPDERAVHHGQSLSSIPPTPLDIDNDQNMLLNDIDAVDSEDLVQLSDRPERHILSGMPCMKKNDTSQLQDYNMQTPDLNEVVSPDEHIEFASAAPSQTFIGSTPDGVLTADLAELADTHQTPEAMEVIFSGDTCEGSVLSPYQKTSPLVAEEAVRHDSSLQFEQRELVTDEVNGEIEVLDSANIAQVVSCPTSDFSKHREQMELTDAIQMGRGQKSVSDLQDRYVCNQEKDLTMDGQVQDDGDVFFPKGSESISIEAPLEKSEKDTGEIPSTPQISTENLLVYGVTSAISCNSCGVEAQPSSCSIEQAEDVNPSLSGDAFAPSSDSKLRPCTSQVNQANLLSAQDGASALNISRVSMEDSGVPSNLQRQENKLQGEPSFEVQDAEEHPHHDPLEQSAVDISNTNEILVDPCQEYTQRNQVNCSSSSEFPEPEKMLLAPNGDVHQANELSQVTEEKGVIESDGSVNRITSLSGKKRRLMETTSALQNDSSEKMIGRSQSRRNTEYIPDDDDLLASILVGKKTPLLKIGSTPPPKATSLKRPRLTSRLCTLKRKVLLDDTTVLHADVIRQQLMNTDDIRRMRKKAPCTRPEIWLIHKCSLEDEIFNEFIITGISAELNDLHTRSYNSENNNKNPYDGSPIESELPGSMEFVSEVKETGTTEQIPMLPKNISGEIVEPSSVSLTTDAVVIDSRSDEVTLNKSSNVIMSAESNMDAHTHSLQQLVEDMVQRREDSSVIDGKDHDLTENASAMDLDFAPGDSKYQMVDNDAFANPNDSCMLVADAHASSELIERRLRLPDSQTPNNSQEDISAAATEVNGETLVPVINTSSYELIEGLTFNSVTIICEGNMPLQDIVKESEEAADQFPVSANEDVNGSVLVDKVENEDSAQDCVCTDENVSTDVRCSEGIEMPSASPTQTNVARENVPSAIGENSNFHEFNPEGGIIVESSPIDASTAKESSDFCSTIYGNDTEFLNEDDEADYHEGDNDVPRDEDASLETENSGWSSRTRGVARYLKKVFNEESGYGKKFVAMEHLIAGKTRKEASRMFFETLVLKTKDYIHVEQENPSDFITIRPRPRLLKSEF